MLVERDVAVPMRDGVVLRADVYRPAGRGPVPVVVNRTPYDRSFSLTPSAAIDPELAGEAGFAVVCQDVRGAHGSQGQFAPFVTEAADGYDTVEWIAAQPWCSGAVGMAGRSYGGVNQWLAATMRPPHLRAIAPVVSPSDPYHGWVYQGGAFQLGFNLFWIQLMAGRRRRGSMGEEFRHLPLTDPPLLEEGVGRFYREWLEHPTHDAYWRALSLDGRHGSVEVPAFNVGGWYDLFLGGTLTNFTRMRDGAGSERARDHTRLVIGPWAHGSTYGPYPDHAFEDFGGVDRVSLVEDQLRFFAQHLHDEGAPEPSGEAPVRLFVMGANRWRDEQAWPLARARPVAWYLRREDPGDGDGELSVEPPASEPPDEYLYDPSDPAATLGGPTSLPGRFLQTNAGPSDQRELERRGDVLVYSSPPLPAPLEVTGPLSAVLYAATSAPDTDFVVKLCDVAPGGASRILAEGVIRTRFRDGFEHPRLLEPGEVARYVVDLVATSNVFRAGHRVRLLVTSSSFPRFDRNPNTGRALGADRAEDLRTARQTIFHDADRASHVVLPVVRA